MKNTVIANRKKEDWPIIKKYFEDRGVDTNCFIGANIECEKDETFYYGIIDGHFLGYSLKSAQQANATILEVSDIEKEFKVGDVVVVTYICSAEAKRYDGQTRELLDVNKYCATTEVKGSGIHFKSFKELRHATPEEKAIYYAQKEIDKALKSTNNLIGHWEFKDNSSEVSDTVTLPKSFVLEAHKSACSDWKKRIEEVVPELFPKNELIVGKWYKKGNAISMFNGVGEYSYGRHADGSWLDRHFWFKDSFDIQKWQPATEQEVFDALKNEAVKRGFKEGVIANNSKPHKETYSNSTLEKGCFSFEENQLRWKINDNQYFLLFKDGIWAEIISIPEELQTLIKKLGKDKIIEILNSN